MQTSQPVHHVLKVPGARLHYEVQGTGPVLMLAGHPMGASGFAPIVPVLAEHYTVVTYDPRGFGRSAIDDRAQDAEPDLIADDMRRVLKTVVDVPAHVFGSSGGAVTGLALIARYPGHVRTLVAHEPPLTLLLPDAEEARLGLQHVYDAFRESGVGAAWQAFAGFTGIELQPPSPESAPTSPSAEMVATSERFFGQSLLPIALYEPDFSALRGASARVVAAGGTTSRGEFAWRTAVALAERLGTPLVEFPGGHGGFASDAAAFAADLRRALTA